MEPLHDTVSSSSVPGSDPFSFNLNYIFDPLENYWSISGDLPIFPVISATRPAIFGIVKTPIHSKRHVIDIASAIIYPDTRDPRTQSSTDLYRFCSVDPCLVLHLQSMTLLKRLEQH